MSEGTFRAVVAAVLVGALALAVVVVVAVLQPSPSPTPAATSTARATQTARPAPTPTPTPQLVFEQAGVTAVGNVPQGGASGTTLVLQFTEPSVDAVPNAAGSFTVTLTDQAGVGTTLGFTGTPSVVAPGSLGASAELAAGNVLRISIVAADVLNIEQMTVTGLGISASADAALGRINATMGDFSGSLAGGVANAVLNSPGTVVAGP